MTEKIRKVERTPLARANSEQPVASSGTGLEFAPTEVRPPVFGSQLVSGEELLKQIFDQNGRPSLKWLRRMTALDQIPFVRIGRLIFYMPRAVMEALGGKGKR